MITSTGNNMLVPFENGDLPWREPQVTLSRIPGLPAVVREIPNLTAIRACGSPSAASLLISPQSSKVITLRSSSSGHFSPAKSFSLRPAPTEPPRDRFGQIKSGQTAALHAPAAAGGVLASDPDRLIRFHP